MRSPFAEDAVTYEILTSWATELDRCEQWVAQIETRGGHGTRREILADLNDVLHSLQYAVAEQRLRVIHNESARCWREARIEVTP